MATPLRSSVALVVVAALVPVIAFALFLAIGLVTRPAGPHVWHVVSVIVASGLSVATLAVGLVLFLGRRVRHAFAETAATRARSESAVRALAGIAHEIAGPLDLPEVADRIVRVTRQTLHTSNAMLFEVDATTGDLVCLAAAGNAADAQWVGRALGSTVGIGGRALAEGRPVWLTDTGVADRAMAYPAWAVALIGDERYSAAAAPLTVKGVTIGVLGFRAEAGRPARPDEIELLSAFAHQAAVVLHDARLYREAALRARRLSVLGRLTQTIGASLDPDETLDAITRAAGELMDTPYAATWIADEAQGTLERRTVGVNLHPIGRLRFGEGLTGWTAQHRTLLNVADASVDPRALAPDWYRESGLRCSLTVPIVHEKSLVGVLTLIGARPFVLEAGVREVLDSFVAQSGIAIQNARLYHEAQRRWRQAETLAVIARTIGATLDLDSVLQQAVEATRDLLESDLAEIALRDGDRMVMRYGAPRSLAGGLEGLTFEKGKGLGGLVWALRRPLRTDGYLEDQRFTHDYDAAVGPEGIVTVLAVPIVIGGEVEGVLYADNRSARPFTGGDEVLLTDVAQQVAVAIQNARLYERAEHARERLGGLSRRLLDVQETERRNLARELHDEIGQLLTGLALMLERSKRLSGGASRDCVSDAQALLGELLSRVRGLSLDLRPAVLDDLGLLPALLWHFDRYTTSTGVRVVFTQTGLDDRRFVSGLETAAYRIVQEALTNVARHSGAPEVVVNASVGPRLLTLEVSDAGIGFDPGVVLKSVPSGGLAGIHERARLASGRATIASTPGAGTRLTAELPIDVLWGANGAVE